MVTIRTPSCCCTHAYSFCCAEALLIDLQIEILVLLFFSVCSAFAALSLLLLHQRCNSLFFVQHLRCICCNCNACPAIELHAWHSRNISFSCIWCIRSECAAVDPGTMLHLRCTFCKCMRSTRASSALHLLCCWHSERIPCICTACAAFSPKLGFMQGWMLCE